jgi:hypothetical protein
MHVAPRYFQHVAHLVSMENWKEAVLWLMERMPEAVDQALEMSQLPLPQGEGLVAN